MVILVVYFITSAHFTSLIFYLSVRLNYIVFVSSPVLRSHGSAYVFLLLNLLRLTFLELKQNLFE